MGTQDRWLARMWLVSQVIMFCGLLVCAVKGIGDGTVDSLLAAVSGSLVGGNVYHLVAGQFVQSTPDDLSEK